jgi:arylsulfatase A-like enzyme
MASHLAKGSNIIGVWSIFTWVMMSITFAQAADPPASAEQPPNIVIVMSDDMGFSDLGSFGGEIQTPNLDQLANKGIRFTQFYSENMCWVSRASMLTGTYHTTSLVNHTINSRSVTLPEALKTKGYSTYMSGKWHLSPKKKNKVFPVDRGFDQWYGLLGGAGSYFAPHGLYRDNVNVEQEYQDKDFYLTDSVSEQAVRYIKEAAPDKPLFLYVAYTAAHWPLHAQPEDIEAYKGKYAMGWDRLREQRFHRMKELGVIDKDTALSPRNPNVPAWEKENNKQWQQRRMEVYSAQITAMDRGVGQVVEALKQTGRFENTLIVYTNDNGACHVEYSKDRKGSFLPKKTRAGSAVVPGNIPNVMPGPEHTYQSYGYGWANASNTPFRLFKQYDHEGGIRTPMIAHWPKGIKNPGSMVKRSAHLIDIMPTILDITGASKPDKINGKNAIAMDGHSLAPAFNGKPQPEHDALFFFHSRGRAIRQGDWKLVKAEKAQWELYNVADDPNEQHNQASKMPGKVKTMALRWNQWSAFQQQRVKTDN